MQIVHAIAFGIFILILTYLALVHSDGVSAVLVGTKVTSIDEIKALQGRDVQYR